MALQLAQPELSRWENIISALRVNELQSILQHFKINKLGKKQDLVVRVTHILRTPHQQPELIKFVNGMNNRPPRNAPYNVPTALPHRGAFNPTNGYGHNNAMYGNGGVTMGMYNNTNSNIPNPPNPVRGLRTIVLPFYDSRATILEPVELSAIPSGLKTQQRIQLNFSIPNHFHKNLNYRENAPLPRLELQLRFFHLPTSFQNTEQPDDFPPNCNVKIDESMVVLPNIIPTNKPNVEPKRPSRPVNITQNCIPPRDTMMGGRPHRMNIDWTADRRAWAVGIYVVFRVTSDILRDRAQGHVSYRQEANITRQQIIRRLTVGDDDGITMDQIRISLLCPLGKTRMGLPARCRDCTHLQCFDLDLFLRMNEKRPTWKCGICNGNAPYNKLIIDGYFEEVLRDVTDVNEVELLRDGGYQKIKEEINEISDSDDDAPRPSNSCGDSSKPATVSKPINMNDEIITLDSDDDEDLQRGIAASVSDTRKSRSTPRKSKEIEVIDLDDDSPPRPPRALESHDQTNGNQQQNQHQSTPKPSAVSVSSISSPVGTPISFPSTSAAHQAVPWRDNSVLAGNTPNFSYQPMNVPNQAPNFPPPNMFANMWNLTVPNSGDQFTNAFIGGNVPGYRQNPAAFMNYYPNQPRAFPQPQPGPNQTLAEALQALHGNNSFNPNLQNQ